MTKEDLEKVWKWIDLHFHETEVSARGGEGRNVVQSDLDVLKQDLEQQFYKDFG